MDEAVAAQNFELAAQLRDRIKELEGGNEMSNGMSTRANREI